VRLKLSARLRKANRSQLRMVAASDVATNPHFFPQNEAKATVG